ncbi:MAG: biotin transporter BioY [Bacteroidota bacterium]
MAKKYFYIVLGALSIYLGAQIAFDIAFSEIKIPITGQSLAVLVVGFILGKNWGMRAVAVYLIAGCLGLPVFAKGNSGFDTLLAPSGGFLYGFLFAAFFIGWLREQGFDNNFGKYLLAMTLGTAVILIFGVGHLTYLFGFKLALEYGFYPFWQGAVAKIVLGAVIVFLFERFSFATKARRLF